MKKLHPAHLANVQAGRNWAAYACGIGITTLELSFAFPLLFAFTAPLTVGACAAAAIKAAL